MNKVIGVFAKYIGLPWVSFYFMVGLLAVCGIHLSFIPAWLEIGSIMTLPATATGLFCWFSLGGLMDFLKLLRTNS